MNRPHGKNLRKGRFSRKGGIYLLSFVTAHRQPWFADWQAGRVVVASLRRSQMQGQAESLAFVVMPDHVHWLLSLGETDLAGLMRDVKGHSGYHVKRHLMERGLPGPPYIWQEGYHDHALRSEESVVDAARYLVMNRACAGLREDASRAFPGPFALSVGAVVAFGAPAVPVSPSRPNKGIGTRLLG